MKTSTGIAGVAALALCSTANAQFLTNRDLCINSGVDNVGPGIYICLTVNATAGVAGQNEVCDGFDGVDHDIWFTYTAESTGTARVYTCINDNIDTKMTAWPGGPSCPIDGTSLACNNDSCDERSFIVFAVTAGTSYIIQLGKPEAAAIITDPILLVIDEQAPPPPFGVSYCGPGNVNTGGMTAEFMGGGSQNVALNNLNFQTFDVPNNEFGYYLVSRTPSFTMPAGSLGTMCLSGDIGRYSFAVLQHPFPYSPDLDNLPTNTPGSQQTLPGETLHFQLWYRDGMTSGLSNALRFEFQ